MFQVSIMTILTDLPIIIGLLYIVMQTYKWKAAEIIGKIEESAVNKKATGIIAEIEESAMMDQRIGDFEAADIVNRVIEADVVAVSDSKKISAGESVVMKESAPTSNTPT